MKNERVFRLRTLRVYVCLPVVLTLVSMIDSNPFDGVQMRQISRPADVVKLLHRRSVRSSDLAYICICTLR